MMKFTYFTAFMMLVIASFTEAQRSEFVCKSASKNLPQDWITMAPNCEDKMKAQIEEELKASLTYLTMAGHFSRDTVNRPGFAKMFFKAASEERDHAMKLMEYLVMRGGLVADLNTIIREPKHSGTSSWETGEDALRDALKLEVKVTKLITDIVKTCENASVPQEEEKLLNNDYHLVDWLTGIFLEEQLTGQREIAGRISTLSKMKDVHGVLGEFLYDKTLLNEIV